MWGTAMPSPTLLDHPARQHKHPRMTPFHLANPANEGVNGFGRTKIRWVTEIPAVLLCYPMVGLLLMLFSGAAMFLRFVLIWGRLVEPGPVLSAMS